MYASVAKWLRRPPSKRKIVGSTPTGNILCVALSNRQRKGYHSRTLRGRMSPSGIDTRTLHQVPLAEWSKATDSSSVIFGCAGSNPAGYIFLFLLASTVSKNIFFGSAYPKCLVSSVGRASD